MGIDQPWRLPGQYHDTETGLHYNLHRYYDAATGRYISEDPLGLRGGWNRYAYAYGAPLNFIDPTGEIPLVLIIPIVIGVVELSLTLYDIYNTFTTLTDPCATGAEKWATAGGALLGAVAPGGGYSLAGKGVRKAADETEVVQRWMSRAELEATEKTGLLRGGRDGTHYVTDAANSDALRARQRLALPQTPEVRVTMEVPKGVFSEPSRVKPDFNMPGGGMERTASGKVPVRILKVDGRGR